jgi:FAD/FMN-containing dehydrogenase
MEQRSQARPDAVDIDPATGFRGEVLHPGEPGYDQARAVVNAMVDRRPALVVRPTGAADVIEAVNVGRDRGLPVAALCGGHQVAGMAVPEGGVRVDLSRMKGVVVDPATRRARVNAGALWGEVDRETQLFGLATPGGRVTTTGVGGFTLGGGYGWLSSVYGLACDNLVAADVVTADGTLVKVSETENPELLWGLRGGGGNFGIVTSYEFALHPVGPVVQAGMLIHDLASGPEVISAYRAVVESAPEQLVTALAVVQAPPAPFVPPEMVGTPVLGILCLWVGDPAEGAEALAALRAVGPPLMDLVQPMPYTAFQAIVDDFNPSGWRNYHRGLHLTGLTDEAARAFVTAGEQRLSPMTQAIMFRTGGAVSRVPDDATAASYRDAVYLAHPIACWQDAREDATHIGWAQAFSAAMEPFTAGGVYLNFEQPPDTEHVRRGYSAAKWDRLVALKEAWDPRNVFRSNANIAPERTISLPPQGTRTGART